VKTKRAEKWEVIIRSLQMLWGGDRKGETIDGLLEVSNAAAGHLAGRQSRLDGVKSNCKDQAQEKKQVELGAPCQGGKAGMWEIN